jgi:hypothetical protein
LADFVPRAGWSDKPVDMIFLQRTFYPQVFGITFEQDTTVIVPGLTEAWLALGVLGCAISGAILGWFVGRIQSLAVTGNLLCRTVEPLAILLIFSVNRVGILNPIVVDILIFLFFGSVFVNVLVHGSQIRFSHWYRQQKPAQPE